MSDTTLLYRTPADVRAIPNAQWERWLEANTVPWPSFSAAAPTQRALRNVVKATMRRMS